MEMTEGSAAALGDGKDPEGIFLSTTEACGPADQEDIFSHDHGDSGRSSVMSAQ